MAYGSVTDKDGNKQIVKQEKDGSLTKIGIGDKNIKDANKK